MKYIAFISYNSKDDKWAKWLQRKLETYNLPIIVRNEENKIVRKNNKKERLRVFRYRSDLNTISLSDGLAKELDDAKWLIVVCSPNSAKSIWVGKEIQHFINTGRKNYILPFIIDGTSYSNDDKECLHPILKKVFKQDDILGVHINDYGDDFFIFRRRKAIVRIVSLLIEIPGAFNYLWNRYKIRFIERLFIRSLIGIVIIFTILHALIYNKVFDFQVELEEKSAYNTYLPVPDSINLYIQLENEYKHITSNNINSIFLFKNIPGKYSQKNVRLQFNAYGYNSIDTFVKLIKNQTLKIPIFRNNTYGLLSGHIIDENNTPLKDVCIEAEGIKAISDSLGCFTIEIPLKKQKVHPHIIVSKKGYHTIEFKEQSIGTEWRITLIKKH